MLDTYRKAFERKAKGPEPWSDAAKSFQTLQLQRTTSSPYGESLTKVLRAKVSFIMMNDD